MFSRVDHAYDCILGGFFCSDKDFPVSGHIIDKRDNVRAPRLGPCVTSVKVLGYKHTLKESDMHYSNEERERLVDILQDTIEILGRKRITSTEKRFALFNLQRVIDELEPRTPTGQRIRDIRKGAP